MAHARLSPPLMSIDSNHHGAKVVIAGAMGLCASCLALLIRLYVRVHARIPFGKDDYVLIIAASFILGHLAVTFFGVSKGFGRSIDLIDDSNLPTVQKALVASDIIYIIALYFTKCCIITIFIHLSPKKRHNQGAFATLVLSTIWLLVAILLISVNCELKMPWQDMASLCQDIFIRWQVITALDVVVELLLFGLALLLLAGLQMPLRQKGIVLSTFAFRLPLVIFSIIRLYRLHLGIYSINPSFHLVSSAIWTQIQLHYSLIACTVFALKPFMSAVSTNYGNAEGTSLNQSGYNSKQHDTTDTAPSGNSFALQSMTRSASRARNLASAGNTQGGSGDSSLFPEGYGATSATVSNARKHDERSLDSNDSTKMIIKKDIQYSVEYSSGAEGLEELHARDEIVESFRR
ncbi:hypothetical protein FQN55_002136 [Onygenales sp. PD_40]|nr:hypothetical protein FQN55_002136 [Onygenales sp. PD_40]KAK2783531.1 hypothetical protein FQN53_009154 [Emmonsiellopsis sp. PD_33]KAK2784539.1 hypothetical protein FQN52_008960 [Onygenales sp. PD_12]KAK2799303.1 hypothetical protein FQN51_006980 [Onygenales sp. PD_10]